MRKYEQMERPLEELMSIKTHEADRILSRNGKSQAFSWNSVLFVHLAILIKSAIEMCNNELNPPEYSTFQNSI